MTNRDPTAHGSAGSMQRSGIREVFDAVWALPGVIHLEVGEPNFPTPAHVIEAADRAAKRGMTKYTANAGTLELRTALAEKVARVNHLDVGVDNVVVTTGGVGALYSSLLAVAKPGDQVLIGDPSWPNFRMMCELQGLEAAYYPMIPEHGFQPRAADLEGLVTERTKVLMINSPCNPTGVVLTAEVLEELYAFARRHNLWIVSDEVYDEVTFEKPSKSMATLDTDDRVMTTFSFSKTHAMTGWRVGYVVAPEPLAELIIRVQEAITSCASAPAQAAALAATTGQQNHIEEMRSAYQERRDRVIETLTVHEIPAMTPDGAFYVWIDISGANVDDVSFAKTLLAESSVAVVPGTTFGPRSGSYVRISLATAPDELFEGVERIGHAYRSFLA